MTSLLPHPKKAHDGLTVDPAQREDISTHPHKRHDVRRGFFS